ncbi:hypothetical protein AAS23_gp57 [Pantoea phage vB_PagS_AAS23]|uniref:Uncharacterized protein n=1 Tax=Pantoea phage vB_PagS_AAS23 TaxID=2499073 RepID=A0A3S9U7X5_9CAUD|nr:hypothetical protein HOU93_gp57 [Pantoea phage vB_PagS_AAS23]AZS06370.1 hypothetical protein AAS23_gp57 [Pantoea phage vB_PagS_AAS23]
MIKFNNNRVQLNCVLSNRVQVYCVLFNCVPYDSDRLYLVRLSSALSICHESDRVLDRGNAE